MCPSKLLVIFAFASLVTLTRYATAKRSVSSDVSSDGSQVETVDNQKASDCA
ncbi:unnamed protein product [Bemisia tabaci]|uniref:Uncharacterized protein n=1 Tax=Bemisia tabaci TaxID=7038 RepID=A0A9P0AG18_BEMTA|nr:unnamed protein product [Bemisia tabaci]